MPNIGKTGASCYWARCYKSNIIFLPIVMSYFFKSLVLTIQKLSFHQSDLIICACTIFYVKKTIFKAVK